MSALGLTGALSTAPNLIGALLLDMVVGLERQWRQRHTGLTTHALVALGAAAFTSLAILIDGSVDIRMGGLHALESKAIQDTTNVKVEAVVYSASEQDQLVEHLVGDMSLSLLTFSTKWTSTSPPE